MTLDGDPCNNKVDIAGDHCRLHTDEKSSSDLRDEVANLHILLFKQGRVIRTQWALIALASILWVSTIIVLLLP